MDTLKDAYMGNANDIYDELALTIGLRLQGLGHALGMDEVRILATDVDRDAGVDMVCALGRLALDSCNLDAISLALEAQDDHIRSIISMRAAEDHPFVAVQRIEIAEAKDRQRLLRAYLAGNRRGMLTAHLGLASLIERRRQGF